MKHIPTNRLASASPRRQPCRPAARANERGRVVYAPRTGAAAGFTLTEILIALALILIIATLSAVNMVGIAGGITHLPPEKVLQSSIRQARYLAMSRMDTVLLTHDTDAHSYNLLDDKGNILEQDPDGVDNPTSNITVTFTPILPSTDLVTDLGSLSDDDTQYSKVPTQVLLFHASGATAPVKVTLSIDSNDSTFNLDPFSEGPPPKAPTIIPPLPADTN